MKKLISMLLVVAMVLGMSTSVFAGTEVIAENIEEGYSKTISEYDILKNLKSKSIDELKSEGYTDSDIKNIQAISFEKIAQDLKNSTDNELLKKGLSKDDIGVVRRSIDVPTILSQTMGNVTYTVSKLSFEYDSSRKVTKLRTRVTWEWSSAPVQELVDIIAASTSTDFVRVASNSSTAVYYYKNGNKSSTMKSVSVSQSTQGSGKVTYSRFPIAKTYPSTSGKDDKYIAMKGSLIVSWEVSGNCRVVGISGNYGHSIISCTPSIGADSTGGTISFTPTLSVKTGVEDQLTISR